MSEDLAQHFNLKNVSGVLVAQVAANSPAQKAGLKVEDVIIKYDGKPVNDVRGFRRTQPLKIKVTQSFLIAWALLLRLSQKSWVGAIKPRPVPVSL